MKLQNLSDQGDLGRCQTKVLEEEFEELRLQVYGMKFLGIFVVEYHWSITGLN